MFFFVLSNPFLGIHVYHLCQKKIPLIIVKLIPTSVCILIYIQVGTRCLKLSGKKSKKKKHTENIRAEVRGRKKKIKKKANNDNPDSPNNSFFM